VLHRRSLFHSPRDSIERTANHRFSRRSITRAPKIDALVPMFCARFANAPVLAGLNGRSFTVQSFTVTPIDSAGFHFVLVTESLRRLGDSPFSIPADKIGMIGEDAAFFNSLRNAGMQLALSTHAVVAHVDA